jgi:hypothetical protein
MALFERMLELSSQGFACAQIMMLLVLESDERQNADLIRSVGALNNGFRDSGGVCGAFSGGACVIAYFAGQGEPDEMPDPDYDAMVQELFSWFKAEIGGRYGGITCPEVLANDKANKIVRCPTVVEESFNKTIEILEARDLL